MAIKIGICGVGNLGKAAIRAVNKNPDMELVAVFTRRPPEQVASQIGDFTSIPVISLDDVANWKDSINVMLSCGGSKDDLPWQTPMLAQFFNVVDSYDTHNKLLEHYANVDHTSRNAGKLGIISVGWDPGLFSLQRIHTDALLPGGKWYTFWGKGVSQGHSDAIRRISGVKDARQYTIPIESAMDCVREGNRPNLTSREMHLRECFVVLEDDADPEKIEAEIKNMPDYFADYDTIVHFISEETLANEHSGLPHGGFVIYTGETESGKKYSIEYKLQMDSNPEFTASILVAYARATYRMNASGEIGAKFIDEIPISETSPRGISELLRMKMI